MGLLISTDLSITMSETSRQHVDIRCFHRPHPSFPQVLYQIQHLQSSNPILILVLQSRLSNPSWLVVVLPPSQALLRTSPHLLNQSWTSQQLRSRRRSCCPVCRFDLYSISSSSSSLRAAPGLLLLFLDFPPRAGAPRDWLLLALVGGGRTKAKSTEMV
jgi:hypothetical protein